MVIGGSNALAPTKKLEGSGFLRDFFRSPGHCVQREFSSGRHDSGPWSIVTFWASVSSRCWSWQASVALPPISPHKGPVRIRPCALSAGTTRARRPTPTLPRDYRKSAPTRPPSPTSTTSPHEQFGRLKFLFAESYSMGSALARLHRQACRATDWADLRPCQNLWWVSFRRFCRWCEFLHTGFLPFSLT